jgi:hypothetical protein
VHIAKGSARTALHLQSLPPEVRQYIGELEYQLDHTQRRNCRLRKNIRGQQRRLELFHLRQVFARCQNEAPALVAVQ